MDIFAALPLLQALPPERQRQIAPHLRILAFKKGELIFEKGSPRQDLGLLIEGELGAVEYTPGGRQILLATIQPGEPFGELALVDQRPRSASILALRPGKAALLPEAMARQLLEHEPKFAQQLLREIAGKLRKANEQRLILAQPHARARIYTLILRRLERQDDQWVLSPLPPHHELATLANTTRETATRALRQLLVRGILKVEDGRLVVTNLDALEREALENTPTSPRV